MFIVYMGLSYNMLTPAKAISRGLYNIKKGGAAAERIQEIIDTPNPLKDKEDAINIKGVLILKSNSKIYHLNMKMNMY